jgi:hypothetical protein
MGKVMLKKAAHTPSEENITPSGYIAIGGMKMFPEHCSLSFLFRRVWTLGQRL